jgi:preprotein translocase subunit SecG
MTEEFISRFVGILVVLSFVTVLIRNIISTILHKYDNSVESEENVYRGRDV